MDKIKELEMEFKMISSEMFKAMKKKKNTEIYQKMLKMVEDELKQEKQLSIYPQ